MRKGILLGFFVALSAALTAQIRISEIMYNPPESGTDSLEFVEFTNISTSSINMSGYTLTGISYTFGNTTISPLGTVLVCVDSLAIQNVFGVAAYEASGALTNSGEDIVLKDASGVTIDSVEYDNGGTWPSSANGGGYSIVICDSMADQNVGSNWALSADRVTGRVINGLQVYASPGAIDSRCIPTPIPVYSIGQVSQDDANGQPDSTGVEVELRGVVHGYDLDNGSTVQYVLIDGTGGINVRRSGGFTPSYTVTEGDSVHVWGTIGSFRGLTQLNADSMSVISSNNSLSAIQKVDTVGPDVESEYIRIDTVEIISGSWPAPGNSATLQVVTLKMDTVDVRIESDLPFEDSVTTAPLGKFDIIGYGGQFDFSSPYTSGYQITPHFKNHIVQHCLAPSNVMVSNISNSTANVSWTTGGSNTWNIEYGPAGFTQGNGTMVTNVSSNPYQISGLMGGQAYDVYIQDTCQGNGTSAWTMAANFTTSTVPSVTHFEVLSSTELLVAFSDSMDATSATTTSFYTGVMGLSNVALNSSNDTATLTYSSAFMPGVTQTLSIDSMISNASGIDLDQNYSFSFISNTTTPQLVINEIMYNNPESDTLEYIELYNPTFLPQVLGGMSFEAGVEYTFPSGTVLNSGEYLLVALDSSNMRTIFNVNNALQWTSGGLSNSGERIAIVNTDNVVIDEVTYDDRSPWDPDADGGGRSLILCGATSDNTDPANWGIETNTIAGLNASPGMMNTCQPPFIPPLYQIADITTVDGSGEPDSNGVQCAIEGIVTSPNLSEAGASGPDVNFSITTSDNSAGVWAISFENETDLGYTPTLGDSVRAYGEVGNFNGVTQFELDSVKVWSANAMIPAADLITSLGESNEGTVVKACQVTILNPGDWPAVGRFAELEVENQNGDTLLIFIDEHIDVASSISSAPTGLIDISGIGSQYDRSSPYTGGYQLNVRSITDFDTTECAVPAAPVVDSVNTTEAFISTSFGGTYNLEYGPAGFAIGSGTSMMGLTGATTITGLTANTDYEVVIWSSCGDCKESDPTSKVSFTTEEEVSITVAESPNAKALRVYPNPAGKGKVKLSQVSSISVINMVGHVVLEQEDATEFDVSDWPAGMYFVKDQKGQTIKLIVE